MNFPFELRQKEVTLPPGLVLDLQARVEVLDQHYHRIIRCRVTVEGSGNPHRRGLYSIKVDLTLPGAEIVVQKQESANLELAIKRNFSIVTRRLEEHVRRVQGAVKGHA